MASTDEEDDDLGRAIALSLQDATPSPPRARGLLGLDRAAMERERLGGKRKAQSKSLDTVEPTHSKRSRVEEGPPQDKPPQDLPFPKGAVRKTWVRGFPRVPNEDIKIEEVLQRSDLQLAVLSSFIWDMDWLFSKINMARTKIVLVMEAKEETTKTMYRQQTAQMKNLRICFPPMPPNVNIMHSKLMLLSFPAYLRVVVPTANLVHFDWGENGVMENSIFLIDLPRLPSSQRPGNEQSDESRLLPFAQELIAFCRAQGLDESIIKSLQNFDFSATEKYAFIHSIGGAHTGKDEPWRRTGYCGLGRAVSRLGLVPQAKAKPMGLGESHTPLRLDFVSSSVGSLNNEFLSALYLAAMGDDGTTELMWRNAQAAKQLKVTRKQPMSKEALLRSVGRDLKVYFPSDQTVKSSLGGYDNAGTVCFQPQFFNSTKFPRQSLLDCRSTRTGLLMHNKILFVRPSEVSGLRKDYGKSDPVAWAYLGSANCSESAWGRLTLDRSTKQPKMTCRNWECGVVIPVPNITDNKTDAKNENASKETESRTDGLEIFQGVVPVPFEFPAPKMDGEDRVPWYFQA